MAIKWAIIYSASGERRQYGLFDDRENPLFQNTTMVITFATFIYIYIWGPLYIYIYQKIG